MAQSIEVMEQRYQMLLNRKGKNSENVGIMRKLRRKINKAKSGIVLSQYIFIEYSFIERSLYVFRL